MLRLEMKDEEGIAKFRALFDQLEALGSAFSGVQLIGAREDGVNSDDIVKSLMESDRDFFSADDAAADKVAQAMADEVEKRISAAAAKNRPEPKSDALAAAGLREAMKAYMAEVVDRIESQRTADGGSPRGLTSEAYKAYKVRKYGFETPIGKASGQLLQSLVPGGAATGKIELIKK
jgi:hypothetical protein